VKRPGEKMISSDYELEFISYPSEMHLWAGLLLLENKRGIFFSSDLLFGMGEANCEIVSGNWQKEVASITMVQIPDTEQRAKVQQAFSKLNPKFAAVGHGKYLKFCEIEIGNIREDDKKGNITQSRLCCLFQITFHHNIIPTSITCDHLVSLIEIT
jgi:hypothetical protein